MAILGVLLSVIFVAFVFSMAYFPRLKHPEWVRQIHHDATERLNRRQEQAWDQQLNGFFHPTFLPYWGRWDVREAGCRVERVIKAWQPYTRWSKGRPVDYSALTDDARYLKARADFEELGSELLEALAQPVFMIPETQLGFRRDFDSDATIRGRNLEGGLVGLIEARAADGDVAGALEIFHAWVQLSSAYAHCTEILLSMTGTVSLDDSVDVLTGIIPSSAATPDQWRVLASRCLSDIGQLGNLETRLEDTMTTQNLAWYDKSPIRINGELMPMKPQGFMQWVVEKAFVLLRIMQREERFRCNGMTELILRLRSGNYDSTPCQRFSIMGDFSVPRDQVLDHLISAAHLTPLRLLGMGVVSSLLAYRLEQGTFPNSLDALQLDCDTSAVTWDFQKAELFVEVDQAQATNRWKPGQSNFYSDQPWMVEEQTGWRYFLT